jgi:hypothetical protein
MVTAFKRQKDAQRFVDNQHGVGQHEKSSTVWSVREVTVQPALPK